MAGAASAQANYDALTNLVNDISDLYALRFSDLTEKIHDLKLQIRLITKGTPTTEALDSVSSEPSLRSDPAFNEQQYNAHSEMLKKAYRKVAPLTHPDLGGDLETFKQVRSAYATRDLSRLINIYVTLAHASNLYWQQSEDGINYASTEFERFRVMTDRLKANPVFAIARYHMSGRAWLAERAMSDHLYSEIEKYSNELNYLKEQYHGRNANEHQTFDKGTTVESRSFKEGST